MFDAGHVAMTFRVAHLEVKRIAAYLRLAGVKPGQTVAIELPATLHLLFAEAVFHEAAIGCMVPTMVASGTFVPDWLFTNSTDRKIPSRNRVQIDAKAMMLISAQSTNATPIRYPSDSSVCRLVFSSGTTGQPKPVAFTIEALEYRADAASAIWMHNPPFMSLLDVGTVSGFQTFYASIKRVRTYIVPGQPAHNLAQLNKHQIRSIKASPAQISELVEEAIRTNVKVPILEIIQSAGSMLPPKLAKSAREVFGVKIFNLYGATESGTVAARYEDSDDPIDAGFITAGTELQIVDEMHNPLPEGKIGAIRYRRKFQIAAYFRDEVDSSNVFRDGWFYPGDNGSMTREGRLLLSNRSSEIINAGGVKIDPAQVDAVAIETPGVQDAAGFSVENEYGITTFILAIVTTKEFQADQLISLLTEKFGTARPSKLVIVEQIPRNAMGKALRNDLKQIYTQGKNSKGFEE